MSLREDLLELVRGLDEIEDVRNENARLREMVTRLEAEIGALKADINKAVVRMLNAEITLEKERAA